MTRYITHWADRHGKKYTSGLYYKHIMIINGDSSIVNKLETSVNDDARVFIYDRHVFIVQATGVGGSSLFSS